MTVTSATVLVVRFPDLPGLLERYETQPESVLMTLDAHLALVVGELESNGGTAQQFTIHGLLASFGMQREPSGAHERAVAAAAIVVGANERLNVEQPRHRLDVAVGIASGPVVLAENAQPWEAPLLGDCVQVASLLAGQARAGEVLMTEAVHNTVGNTVRAQPNRPRSIVGREAQLVSYTLRPAVLSRLG